MLSAMGLNEQETYIASVLPRHTPMADTEQLAASGMDAVTMHHIMLAQPERILTFGANISSLFAHKLTKDGLSLREINQKQAQVPLLESQSLESMMTMPRLKARFWRRWIEWSAVKH